MAHLVNLAHEFVSSFSALHNTVKVTFFSSTPHLKQTAPEVLKLILRLHDDIEEVPGEEAGFIRLQFVALFKDKDADVGDHCVVLIPL